MQYIAILRGINVGGKRKILMADLRAHLANLGLKDIQTYIQSGNVIFNTQKKTSPARLANQIAELIEKEYGFIVPIVIRSTKEWQSAIAENPFYNNAPGIIEKLHLTFLKETPDPEHLEKIHTYDFSPDQFKIIGQNVYLHITGKYHTSKLTNKFFESKLKVAATTRNWKTVMKVGEMIGD